VLELARPIEAGLDRRVGLRGVAQVPGAARAAENLGGEPWVLAVGSRQHGMLLGIVQADGSIAMGQRLRKLPQHRQGGAQHAMPGEHCADIAMTLGELQEPPRDGATGALISQPHQFVDPLTTEERQQRRIVAELIAERAGALGHRAQAGDQWGGIGAIAGLGVGEQRLQLVQLGVGPVVGGEPAAWVSCCITGHNALSVR
jgi:hypothetical protein